MFKINTYYILDHPSECFDVSPFVDRRCKTPIQEIQAAVDEAISPKLIVKLRQCLATSMNSKPTGLK